MGRPLSDAEVLNLAKEVLRSSAIIELTRGEHEDTLEVNRGPAFTNSTIQIVHNADYPTWLMALNKLGTVGH